MTGHVTRRIEAPAEVRHGLADHQAHEKGGKKGSAAPQGRREARHRAFNYQRALRGENHGGGLFLCSPRSKNGVTGN